MHLVMMKLYITLIYMLCELQIVLTCPPGQVERLNGNTVICCNPVECKPGQQFSLCRIDNGHDTCQNCPDGFGHKDRIDTSIWEYEVNPCRELEDCSQYSDLRQENGECVCDRTRGYFGLDRNLCSVDKNNSCKKAGHEMTRSGNCKMCGDGYFKDKVDYSLCKEKTRCEADQEVNDPGSNTEDRTCRKKKIKISRKHSPAPTHKNVFSGVQGQETEKKKTVHQGHYGKNVTKVTEEITEGMEEKKEYDKRDKESSSLNQTTIIALVSSILAVILSGLIGLVGVKLYKVYKNKGNTVRNEENSDVRPTFSIFNCCLHIGERNNITYNNAQNADKVNFGEEKLIVVNEKQKDTEAEGTDPLIV